MRIVWTLQAIEDVEGIRDFVARDSPHYASLLAQRLVGAVEHLSRFPESGRIVPELGVPSIREVIRGDYRIVYSLRSEQVEILTVYHGTRLFPDLGSD
jgi:plasmid stabilization system protein ParE